MRRVKLLVLAVVLTVAMWATSALPASAQGYTGWIQASIPKRGLLVVRVQW
jgi:hypothetical protein